MKNTDQLIHTHKHEKMSELNIWLKYSDKSVTRIIALTLM